MRWGLCLVAVLALAVGSVHTPYAQSSLTNNEMPFSQWSSRAAAKVTVEAAQPEAVKSMAGFLAGGGPNGAVASEILQVAPRIVRGAFATALTSPEQTNFSGFPALATLGTQFVYTLSFRWGSPKFEWQCPGCPNLGPPYEHWQEWEDFVRDKVTTLLSLVDPSQVYVEVWNEPTPLQPQGFWDGTEAQFFETYRRAERVIHQVSPTVRVAGPSHSAFEKGSIKRFFDYCVLNSCQVNVVTWHELLRQPPPDSEINPNDPPREISEIPDHVRWVKKLMSKKRYRSLQAVETQINEYAGLADFLRPGEAVAYLAALEASGVDAAARSCWDVGDICYNGTLAGLFTSSATGSPQRTSMGEIYVGYAAGVNDRRKATSNDPAISVLASGVGLKKKRAQILIAHSWRTDDPLPSPRTVVVQINDVRNLRPNFAQRKSLRVATRRIRPDPTVEQDDSTLRSMDVTIPASNRIRIRVSALKVHEAAIITIW